jgi:hypothetical protein
MTAKDAKAMSDRNKWLKISSTIRDTILESCNIGETDVYIERTKLTLTDISYLIDFCFLHCVPTRDTLLNQTDDIGKYLYFCIEHRRCAVCNAKADIHHVNAVGMGRDRTRISHIGMEVLALCRTHHNEAHTSGDISFCEKYHIYGIKLDEYLCEKLNLRKELKK